MITDSNHACFTKMSGCGFQEESSRLYDLIIPFPLFISQQIQLSFWQVPLPLLLLWDHQSTVKGHFLEVR
jgi:hypothetical protein